MTNFYTDQIYKEVQANGMDLKVLQELKKMAEAHDEHVVQLIDLINYKIDNLLDFEKTFERKGGRKPIIQYNLEGNEIKYWDSITEAGIELNIHSKSISNVVNGRANSCGGFIFKYVEDPEEKYREENYFNNN